MGDVKAQWLVRRIWGPEGREFESWPVQHKHFTEYFMYEKLHKAKSLPGILHVRNLSNARFLSSSFDFIFYHVPCENHQLSSKAFEFCIATVPLSIFLSHLEIHISWLLSLFVLSFKCKAFKTKVNVNEWPRSPTEVIK